jgi:hypothetical protein
LTIDTTRNSSIEHKQAYAISDVNHNLVALGQAGLVQIEQLCAKFFLPFLLVFNEIYFKDPIDKILKETVTYRTQDQCQGQNCGHMDLDEHFRLEFWTLG